MNKYQAYSIEFSSRLANEYNLKLNVTWDYHPNPTIAAEHFMTGYYTISIDEFLNAGKRLFPYGNTIHEIKFYFRGVLLLFQEGFSELLSCRERILGDRILRDEMEIIHYLTAHEVAHAINATKNGLLHHDRHPESFLIILERLLADHPYKVQERTP